jgi:hypothetical protein
VFYEFTAVLAPLTNEFGLVINLTPPSYIAYTATFC